MLNAILLRILISRQYRYNPASPNDGISLSCRKYHDRAPIIEALKMATERRDCIGRLIADNELGVAYFATSYV